MSEDSEGQNRKMLDSRRNDALLEFSTEGLLIIDKQGYFAESTAAAENILGYSRKKLQTYRLQDLLHPEDRGIVDQFFSSITSTVETFEITYFRLRTSDHNFKSFSGSFRNKFDDPLINGSIFTFRIVSEKIVVNSKTDTSSTQNLLENEFFSEHVLSSLTDQVAVMSRDGTIIAVNKAWDDFAKQPCEVKSEICSVGSNYIHVCETAVSGGEQIVRKTINGIRSVFNKEVYSYHQEYPCFSPSKKSWFILNVLPFSGDDTKVVITHQDITQKKIAEDNLSLTTEKLKSTLLKLTAVLDSSLDLICTINEKMEFETVNKASINLLGYRPEELIGRKYIDFVHKEDIIRTLEVERKIYNGSPEYHFENCYVHKSGKHVYLLWSVIWDYNLELMYCVAKDMTESRKLKKSIEMERDHYYDMFLKAPSAVVLLKGANHVYELANPLYLKLVGKTDIIGKTVAEVIPEVAEQGFIKMLDSVYQTGNSVRGTEVLIKLDFRE